MKKSKLHKSYCEIEDCRATDSSLLHHHHIVERKEIGTSNNEWNLAVICSNCHNLVHAGKIEIIGVFPSTNQNGRVLVYKKNGIQNIPGISEPYFKKKPEAMKIG